MTTLPTTPIERNDIDTRRSGNSSEREAQVTITATAPIIQPSSPTGQITVSGPCPDETARRRYVAPMTTSANVIAAIDARKPNLPDTYKHNLLLFCQGHYLATHGYPMFDEPINAVATGAEVHLGTQSGDAIGRKALGMLGWVLHRYGSLFPVDLQSLVTVSEAWQVANRSGGRIDQAWLTSWFSRPAELSADGRLAVAGIGEVLRT